MSNPNKLEEPPLPRVTIQDFAPFAECDERLSDVQIKAIRNMVYYRLCLIASQGPLSVEEEAAFFNGAMAAFFACRSNDKVPAPWVLGREDMLDTLARWKAEGRLKEGA